MFYFILHVLLQLRLLVISTQICFCLTDALFDLFPALLMCALPQFALGNILLYGMMLKIGLDDKRRISYFWFSFFTLNFFKRKSLKQLVLQISI